MHGSIRRRRDIVRTRRALRNPASDARNLWSGTQFFSSIYNIFRAFQRALWEEYPGQVSVGQRATALRFHRPFSEKRRNEFPDPCHCSPCGAQVAEYGTAGIHARRYRILCELIGTIAPIWQRPDPARHHTDLPKPRLTHSGCVFGIIPTFRQNRTASDFREPPVTRRNTRGRSRAFQTRPKLH